MSDWRMQGAAQRRRMGAASNHYESTGGPVGVNNIPSPEEAIAGMARIGNPRQPMGNAAFSFNNASAAPSKNTIPMPKNHSKGAPALGVKANKENIDYPKPAGRADRNGAGYRIVVNMPAPVAPEATMTQANGRIIKSAVNRSLPNFSEEVGYSRS